MAFFNFFKDRKWHSSLKVSLEIELARIPAPGKKGKTIHQYFDSLKDYATRFAHRKIEYIKEFERKHNITFSDRYKRKYMAHCFDSYCEDLQQIALNLLEIEFAFIINQEKAEYERIHELCSERLLKILNQYVQKPLERFLPIVLSYNIWEHKHKEKFQSILKDITNTLEKRGQKEISKFFKNYSKENLNEKRMEFLRFLEYLRSEGFKI